MSPMLISRHVTLRQSVLVDRRVLCPAAHIRQDVRGQLVADDCLEICVVTFQHKACGAAIRRIHDIRSGRTR